MKNLRNKNHPPSADIVQQYLETSYDVVKAVYDALPLLIELGEALQSGDLDDFLAETDIDTLVKLNTIVTDANMGDRPEFATAAQGILADNSMQLPIASQAEAEAGADNERPMTPLRVAQAIAVLAADIQNNYTAVIDPTVNDDSGSGYAAGSVWINTVTEESYRCSDPSVGAAVWIKTTLTADELALVAITGDSDDLIEGSVNLLMTVAERVRLATMEDGAKDDQTGSEIKALYESESNTNAFTDAEKAAVAIALLDSDFVASDGYMLKTGAETYTIVKANLAATTPPGAGHDSNLGYAPGSQWVDTTNDKIYWCLDATVGAAIWLEVGAGGGGGGGLAVEFKTTNFTAEAGKKYFVDTTGGAVVVTLPAGVDLDNLKICDIGHYASTNNITVNPDGAETIDDDTVFVIDQNEGDIDLGYDDANTNWQVSSDGTPDIVYGGELNGAQRIMFYPERDLTNVSSGGTVPLSTLDLTAGFAAKIFSFDASNYESVGGIWVPPPRWDNSVNCRYRVHWRPSNTNTDVCRWRFAWAHSTPDVGEALVESGALGYIVSDDSGLGVTDDTQISPWADVDMSAGNPGDAINILIQRAGGHASDTFTGTAEMYALEFEYTTNAPTDD